MYCRGNGYGGCAAITVYGLSNCIGNGGSSCGNSSRYRADFGNGSSIATATGQRIGYTSANSTADDDGTSANKEVSARDFASFFLIFWQLIPPN
jgi:hypothetical protein